MDNKEKFELRPKILVIDDSRLMRVSISRVLRDEFTILEAEDGELGWTKLIQDKHIQVIITDADMPNLNGYDLIDRIRHYDQQEIKQLPIIMITAANDEATRQKALTLGASDFITKPFDKSQLLARVRSYVRLEQTTRDLDTTTEALSTTATDDFLTGVSSRRFFLKRGEQDLAYAIRSGKPLSVIGVGIDNFGSPASDKTDPLKKNQLKFVAKIIQQNIRTEDTIARINEGHFAILAPNTSRLEAAVLSNRIRNNMEAAQSKTNFKGLTVSIGLVFSGENNITLIEDYLNEAISRLINAQNNGGNRLSTTGVSGTVIPAVSAKPTVDFNEVMNCLKHDTMQKHLPNLDSIVEQLVPLLHFINQQKKLDLGPLIEKLARSKNITTDII